MMESEGRAVFVEGKPLTGIWPLTTMPISISTTSPFQC